MLINDFTYFYPEKPVLISIKQPLLSRLSESENYCAEKKYNGQRLELHFLPEPQHFEFWGREGERLTYMPDKNMIDALGKFKSKLTGYCMFDGELRHNKTKGVQHKMVLYDVFMWDGRLLVDLDFEDRRKILENILKIEDEPIGITDQYDSHFKELFEGFIKDPEIEGLVMKNRKGKLNLGRKAGQKSRWMYKVRRPTKNYRF